MMRKLRSSRKAIEDTSPDISQDEIKPERTSRRVLRNSKKEKVSTAGDNKTSKRVPTNKASRKGKKLKPGYEADTENSSGGTDQSDVGALSSDLYDFNFEDSNICQKLSFEETVSSKRKQTPAKSSTKSSMFKSKGLKAKDGEEKLKGKETKGKKSPAIKTLTKKTATKTSSTGKSEKKVRKATRMALSNHIHRSKKQPDKVEKKVAPAWEFFSTRTSSRKRVSSLAFTAIQNSAKRSKQALSFTPISKQKSAKSKDSPTSTSSDSGVYLSPPDLTSSGSCKENMCTSTPNHSATFPEDNLTSQSTPSIILAGNRTLELEIADSLMHFEVSPVRASSKFEESLLDDEDDEVILKLPSAEKSYSKISMAGLSHQEKKERRRKGGRYSTSKVDNWAAQVNSAFEEIENYELSID